jgi:alpha-L-rhamnosidase
MMTEPASPGRVVIRHVRTQLPPTVLTFGRERPVLTWQLVADPFDLTQLAYEIEAAADPDFAAPIATTGVVRASRQIAVPAPGPPLRSRERRFLRVRVLSDAGWSGWSAPTAIEAGLLETDDWQAEAISLPDDPGADRPAAAPLLRRAFVIDVPVEHARLHVTALGLYWVTINGQPVSQDLLAPGWTPYRARLLADTYDVASLLVPGENVIAAALGDGWYRGRLGWDPGRDRAKYGREVALIAQLEMQLSDGTSQTIATDASWSTSTGAIRSADLYDGSVIDLREHRDGWDMAGFDATDWQAATPVPFDPAVIEPRTAPPVRRIAELPVTMSRDAHGRVLMDSGQNLAGFVRLTVRGERGHRVVVRHAEVLEPDGSLHTRSLRSALATDEYVLADDRPIVLEPAFTFHGFRYALVETTAEVLEAVVVAISTANEERSRFECSDPDLNRLHENVVWSQRANFISLPTDCPQRDERLGWTGDAQAFAATASTLFDSLAFWKSWLRDLAHEQHDELGVPSVVPDVVLDGEMRYGRAGWADAATIVPWSVYESYGDPAILADQFDSMRRWVDSLSRRRAADGLLTPSQQFGDWLDPDAPPDRPWEAKANPEYLANAFFAQSARLVAEAATIAGEPDLVDPYRDLATDVAARTWTRWSSEATTNQTGCAIALQFQIAAASDRPAVARALADLVRAADGRVATGFLGTPLVLPALSEAGYIDECYLMLLRRDAPSWLYQVDRGATTVWERWDAILPDGSIHPGRMAPNPVDPEGREGHMLSFNHYAYGAVIDWVYRHVAGLAPDLDEPGYRSIRLSPKPCVGIDWARASVDTPLGPAQIEWRTDSHELIADVEIPAGSTGTFVAPATEISTVRCDGELVARQCHLAPGHHKILVSNSTIADPRRVPRN